MWHRTVFFLLGRQQSLSQRSQRFRAVLVVVVVQDWNVVVVVEGQVVGEEWPLELSLGMPEALAAGPGGVAHLARAAEGLEVVVRPQLVLFVQVLGFAVAQLRRDQPPRVVRADRMEGLLEREAPVGDLRGKGGCEEILELRSGCVNLPSGPSAL